MGPLKGIRVLDLTRVLAGPYCTMLLADLGAEVIKVEMPGSGDDSRHFGPFLNGESAYFMSLNRNKQSVTLNLKSETGKEMLRELVKQVDVLVENFKPGTMARLGLDYEQLKELNPSLIYAASTGFGQTGPYSERPAYDGVVQAMGGIMSITGSRGGKPTRVGPSIGDIAAGIFTAIGVLAALHHRTETGQGQMVDVAMLDCQVSMLENAIARYAVSGEIPQPEGNRHPSISPFEPFETADYPLMLAIGNDKIWAIFCRTVGREDLLDDERFASVSLRREHYEILTPIIAEILKQKTNQEWQDLFNEVGVPNGPINTVDRVVHDEQVNFRDMIVEVDHPLAGKLKMPGVPIKLSETPGEIRTAAPLLGADNETIYGKMLDLTPEEVAQLKQDKII